jgi:hypothetical protein
MSRIIGVRQSCATFNPKMLSNRHLDFMNDLSHFYHMPEFKRSYIVGISAQWSPICGGQQMVSERPIWIFLASSPEECVADAIEYSGARRTSESPWSVRLGIVPQLLF